MRAECVWMAWMQWQGGDGTSHPQHMASGTWLQFAVYRVDRNPTLRGVCCLQLVHSVPAAETLLYFVTASGELKAVGIRSLESFAG